MSSRHNRRPARGKNKQSTVDAAIADLLRVIPGSKDARGTGKKAWVSPLSDKGQRQFVKKYRDNPGAYRSAVGNMMGKLGRGGR